MATSTIDTLIHLASVAIIAIIGLLAYRSGISKTQASAQDNTIRALQGEINVLKDRITEIEKENHRHTQTIDLIKKALGQRGLIVTIDGDLVTIIDSKAGSTSSARIQEDKA